MTKIGRFTVWVVVAVLALIAIYFAVYGARVD